MKKVKTFDNKGFSLVELIIVIAIMAILIGILAPNLMRYIERTNVSGDTQVADGIRTALLTALADPINDEAETTRFRGVIGSATSTSPILLSGLLAGKLANDIADTMSIAPPAAGDQTGATIHAALVTATPLILRSRRLPTAAPVFVLHSTDGGNIIVTILNTNSTGSRRDADYEPENRIAAGGPPALGNPASP